MVLHSILLYFYQKTYLCTKMVSKVKKTSITKTSTVLRGPQIPQAMGREVKYSKYI